VELVEKLRVSTGADWGYNPSSPNHAPGITITVRCSGFACPLSYHHPEHDDPTMDRISDALRSVRANSMVARESLVLTP
jgi:hypothetical protein